MSEKPTYEELEQRIRKLEQESEKLKYAEKIHRKSEHWWSNFISKNIAGIWQCEFNKPMPLSLPIDEQIEWILDRGVMVEVNDVAAKMYGFSGAEELIGKTYGEIFKDDKKTGRRMVQTWIQQGYKFDKYEDYLITNVGEYRWIMKISHSLVEKDHIIGSWGTEVDVTDRKLAENAQRESEERYRTLFESANDAILILKDSTCIECNQKALEMFGRTREQIIGQEPHALSPPRQSDGRKSNEKGLEKIKAILAGEANIFEWDHIKLNGEPFVAEVSFNLIQIKSERFIMAMLRDITERKKMGKKVQLMQHWIEQSVDLFFWVREDSQVIYVNQAVCNFLGYSHDELCAMKVGDFDLDLPLSAWPDFTTKLREQRSYCFETRLRKKNGKVFPVEITANILEYNGIDHFFAYGRDISVKIHAEENRKELEKQLRQAQKLEAIGTLAGGIAHDFNNILSSIIGYAELSRMEMHEKSKESKYLDGIFKAANRAKNLTQQILTFSRQTEQVYKSVSVKLVAKEVLELLRASLPSSIEIRQNFISDSMVMGDPTQIHQILMNLCTNAGHSMLDKGGTLEVEIADVELDAAFTARSINLKPGAYVKVTVNDNGYGIPPGMLDRVFDPFFTTKDQGEGTGMGLAVVHGIVENYGGMIQAYSEQRQGSSFQVFLPKVDWAPEAAKVVEKELPLGAERVLFVDDEPDLVVIGEVILASLGYEVTSMTDPTEALELLRARPSRFDLLITDLTMPKMTGDTLAREILSIRPGFPVILCTGFSHRITEEKARALQIKGFLMKPILRSEMATLVRKVLDEARPSTL
jgi:PAS domain S-box-containing protein